MFSCVHSKNCTSLEDIRNAACVLVFYRYMHGPTAMAASQPQAMPTYRSTGCHGSICVFNRKKNFLAKRSVDIPVLQTITLYGVILLLNSDDNTLLLPKQLAICCVQVGVPRLWNTSGTTNTSFCKERLTNHKVEYQHNERVFFRKKIIVFHSNFDFNVVFCKFLMSKCSLWV